MKNRLLTGLLVGLMFFIFASVSMAALINRGTDSAGNKLIYDTELDITWYDFTKSQQTYDNQVAWAASLSITFNEVIYDDWRLPTTVDGVGVYGYEGPESGDSYDNYNYTYTYGYNLYNSEMGYLYYKNLGNVGAKDTANNDHTPPLLTNVGPFSNLLAHIYWSGTEYGDDDPIVKSWYFNFWSGEQNYYYNNTSNNSATVLYTCTKHISCNINRIN